MLGHDRRNTSSTGLTVPDDSLTARRVLRIGKPDRTDAPIYASNRILLARSETRSLTSGAFALEPGTGEQLWHNPDVVDYTTPSVYGETAIFSGGANTFAVDIETGRVYWRRNVGGSGFYQTHLKRDDRIVVRSGRRVVALDAYTGETRWQSKELGVPYGLAADDDRIYVTTGGTDVPALRALEWTTGETAWEVEGIAPVLYPVVSEGQVLYTDVETGTLWAFDAASGERLWHYETVDADAPPAVSPDGETIFLSGIDEPQLHVVSAANGTREWSVQAQSAYQPLVTGESVFLAGYDIVERLSLSRREVTDSIQFRGKVTSPLALGPYGPILIAQSASSTYFAYVTTPEDDSE